MDEEIIDKNFNQEIFNNLEYDDIDYDYSQQAYYDEEQIESNSDNQEQLQLQTPIKEISIKEFFYNERSKILKVQAEQDKSSIFQWQSYVDKNLQKFFQNSSQIKIDSKFIENIQQLIFEKPIIVQYKLLWVRVIQYFHFILMNFSQNNKQNLYELSLLCQNFLQIFSLTSNLTLNQQQFSSIHDFNQTLKLKINITEEISQLNITNLLQQLIMEANKQEQQNLSSIFSQFFMFCLSPPNPFYHTIDLESKLVSQLEGQMFEQDNWIIFQQVQLLSLSNQKNIYRFIFEQLPILKLFLEEYFKIENQKVNNIEMENQNILEKQNVRKLLELLKLLAELSKDSKIAKILQENNLYQNIYYHIKSFFFSLTNESLLKDNKSKKKVYFPDKSIINMAVVVIQNLIINNQIDLQFVKDLIIDLLQFIDKNDQAFISEIILAILQSNCIKLIPVQIYPQIFPNELKKMKYALNQMNNVANKMNIQIEQYSNGLQNSDILTDKYLKIFNQTFQKVLTQSKKEIQFGDKQWRRIITAKSYLNNQQLNFHSLYQTLNMRNQILFIIDGETEKIHHKFLVYINESFQEINQTEQKKINISKQLQSKNNIYSFILNIYYQNDAPEQIQDFSFLSTCQLNSQHFILQNALSNVFVKLLYYGFEVNIADVVIININIGNISSSKINIPYDELNAYFTGTKPNIRQELLEIQNIEIWELADKISANDQASNYQYQMGRFFTNEKLIFVPENLQIHQLKQIFLQQIKNEQNQLQFLNQTGDIIHDNFAIKELQELNQGFQNINFSNSIVKLFINENIQNHASLQQLNEQFTIFENIQIFQQYINLSYPLVKQFIQCNGFDQILQRLTFELNKRQQFDGISIFFFELNQLLLVQDIAQYFLSENEFLTLILALVFDQNLNENQKLHFYHKVNLSLYMSLYRYLKKNVGDEISTLKKKQQIEEIFSKTDVYKIILNKIVFYQKGSDNISQKQLIDQDKQLVQQQPQKQQKQKDDQYIVKGVGYLSTNIKLKEVQKQITQNETESEREIKAIQYQEDIYVLQLNQILFGSLELLLTSIDDCENEAFLSQISQNKIINSSLFEVIFSAISIINILQANAFQIKIIHSCLKILLQLQKDISLLHLFVKNLGNNNILFNNALSVVKQLFEQCQIFKQYQDLKNNFPMQNQNLLLIDQLYENLVEQLQKYSFITVKHITNEQLIQEEVKQNTQDSINQQGFNQQGQQSQYQVPSSIQIQLKLNELQKMYQTIMRQSLVGPALLLNNGQIEHFYATQYTKTISANLIARLTQEISDLQKSLPSDATNAIFVRYDKNNINFMKAIIIGAHNTPYSSGCYQIDIYFPDNYPEQPPKCTLMTTGKGKIRFNPNLYQNGQICLSLLGTWRGQTNENWNPQISSLLQVLVSIQSIIMSDYVYFNEPSYESQINTIQGKQANIAYSNIVKYGNINYAMIDQINEPTPGFEDVIYKHFYFKKDLILAEVKQWFNNAATEIADYNNNLVKYHNPDLVNLLGKCQEDFQKNLKQSIFRLEETFKNLKLKIKNEFQNMTQPNEQIVFEVLQSNQIKQKQQIQDNKQIKINILNENDASKFTLGNINEIDISYEESNSIQEKFNISNKEVSNRLSRYIGAVGIDSVQKQSEAEILLIGLNALGVEIAKNIVLSGIKRLTIFDSNHIVENDDIIGNFFLDEQSIGLNRVQCILHKIQALSIYVYVDVVPIEIKEIYYFLSQEFNIRYPQFNLQHYQVIIMTDYYSQNSNIVLLNDYCRNNKKQFILAETQGLFSRIFVDFGEQFTIIDQNGEIEKEYQITTMTQNNDELIVGIVPNQQIQLQFNDIIMFIQLEPLLINQQQSDITCLNNKQFKIKSISQDRKSFTINIGNLNLKFNQQSVKGQVKEVKQQATISFKPYKEIYSSDKISNFNYYEHNSMATFTEKEAFMAQLMHMSFKILENNEKRNNFKESLLIYTKNKMLHEQEENFIQIFINNINKARFPPLDAYIGGITAQEALKAITRKFTPIQQLYYFNLISLYNNDSMSEQEFFNNKYLPLCKCIGANLFKQLAQLKLFQVGAGAIGCELLKNFAMLGLCTKGQLIVTDPDMIENSNLSRQFLFREKHIRKAKSTTACASIIQMNKDLQNHIIPCLDKVSPQTEIIYNEQFFSSLDIVTTGLDNIDARKFIDNKCVESRVPLVDSGTLGTKGHVQPVIPYLSESYNSKEDPIQDDSVPVCTIKQFPEEAIHCVEWALEKFEHLFVKIPQTINKTILTFNQTGELVDIEMKLLQEIIELIQQTPKNFDDCFKLSKSYFDEFFNIEIYKLLQEHPLDKVDDKNNLFWSPPRRPPTQISLNINDSIHQIFIISFLALLTYTYNIIPSENIKSSISQFFLKILQVQNQDENQNKQLIKCDNEKQNGNDPQQLFKILFQQKNLLNFQQLKISEFEKDNSENFHIDFIYSLAYLRCSNYKIKPMDWLEVKLKAGKIIPAMITSTSVIAALQTIELVKIFKKSEFGDYRFSSVNLGLASIIQSELELAKQIQLSHHIKVNLWERWEFTYSEEMSTIGKLLDYLKIKLKLYPVSIIQGKKPIYIAHSMQSYESQQQLLNSQLFQVLEFYQKDKNQIFADIQVTFKIQEDDFCIIEKNVPLIRIII